VYIMDIFIKCLIVNAFLFFLSLLARPTYAQTITKNTDWLEKQFGKLIKDERDTPKFTFKGCQMNMAVDTKDKDASIEMNMAWQLKDIRKVSYRRGKNGQYTLLLDVPTDKVSMAMSLEGFSGSFNTNGRGNHNQDNLTSLNLDTKDESLVKQVKQKIEETVQLCRHGKD
jgi:hypothetical protein